MAPLAVAAAPRSRFAGSEQHRGPTAPGSVRARRGESSPLRLVALPRAHARRVAVNASLTLRAGMWKHHGNRREQQDETRQQQCYIRFAASRVTYRTAADVTASRPASTPTLARCIELSCKRRSRDQIDERLRACIAEDRRRSATGCVRVRRQSRALRVANGKRLRRPRTVRAEITGVRARHLPSRRDRAAP